MFNCLKHMAKIFHFKAQLQISGTPAILLLQKSHGESVLNCWTSFFFIIGFVMALLLFGIAIWQSTDLWNNNHNKSWIPVLIMLGKVFFLQQRQVFTFHNRSQCSLPLFFSADCLLLVSNIYKKSRSFRGVRCHLLYCSHAKIGKWFYINSRYI